MRSDISRGKGGKGANARMLTVDGAGDLCHGVRCLFGIERDVCRFGSHTVRERNKLSSGPSRLSCFAKLRRFTGSLKTVVFRVVAVLVFDPQKLGRSLGRHHACCLSRCTDCHQGDQKRE